MNLEILNQSPVMSGGAPQPHLWICCQVVPRSESEVLVKIWAVCVSVLFWAGFTWDASPPELCVTHICSISGDV